jgi:REP element-mobilizing transposase RayT
MKTWHLVLSEQKRTTFAPTPLDRRNALRRVARISGDWLLAFCLVDDHLHLFLHCERRRLAWIGRNISQSLGTHGLRFQPMYTKHVDSRRYRTWLVRYLLTQPSHHCLAGHPALWNGSCFLDLVGARCLEGFDSRRLFSVLPRLARRHLFEMVDLPPHLPPGEPDLSELGPAAREAFVCRATLVDKSANSMRAKRAAVAIGRSQGLPSAKIARLLDITPRAARYALKGECREGDRETLRRYLALQQTCLNQKEPRSLPRHSPLKLAKKRQFSGGWSGSPP